MILAFTLVAIVLVSAVYLNVDKHGKMTSYMWGLLGYPSTEEKSADAIATQSSNSHAKENGKGKAITQVDEPPQIASPRLEEEESTPKAKPAANGSLPPVPSFALQTHEEDDSESEDDLPPPSFPALNSAQRASAMPPPKIPTLKPLSNGAASANGLMAPPPRPMMSRPTPPSASAGLRVPTTGPLPNRNPTSNSLATPGTTAVITPNPRKKVLLKPGHSPLDWATLKRSGSNLSGVDRLVRVTPSLLKEMNGRKDRSSGKHKPAWSVYQGKVYNLTPYLPFHPGGEGELRRVAGKDGAKLFHEVHPWVNWENMLEGCLVGIMVSESEGEKELTSPLDDMD